MNREQGAMPGRARCTTIAALVFIGMPRLLARGVPRALRSAKRRCLQGHTMRHRVGGVTDASAAVTRPRVPPGVLAAGTTLLLQGKALEAFFRKVESCIYLNPKP